MDIYAYKNDKVKQIAKSLQAYLKSSAPRIRQLKDHYQDFSASHFGGKFLRGMLVCLGYEMAGKKADEHVLKIAGALEMLHTALLIHDDIIDESALRRGKPSLHVALGDKKRGESLALCFGDLGIIWAMQIINNSSFKNEFKNKALDFFCENVRRTV